MRATALRAVGGAATETITEDIHTTIRLHRAGWRTVYHNEVLARGLAADDAAQYQLQRNRWGTGAMQVLRVENPLTVPGLTIGQRLGYTATLLGWFDSWRTLGFLVLPPLVLVTGQIPILADGMIFAVAFGVTYGLQQAALYLLGRGAYRPLMSIVFDLVRMSSNFLATMTLFTSRTPAFRVTPKGRIATDRGRIQAPVFLRATLGASFIGAAVYLGHLLGIITIGYAAEWAAGVFSWLGVNAGLVWVAMRRIRSIRFAAERRNAVRFAVDIPGAVDGSVASVQDVSVGGALIATSEPLVERETHLLSFELADRGTSLWARIRSSRRAASGEHHYAFEFEPGQYPAKGVLARAVFVGRYAVAGVERHAWSELLRREIGSLSYRFQSRARIEAEGPVVPVPG